jgi:hypothetical protein
MRVTGRRSPRGRARARRTEASGARVPLQNRVTPFSELIATDARGTLMGNRGILHDPRRQIRRAFVGTRWIICVLEFKNRHRTVMTPNRYTELFFLDEASALAAGHRPCAECQRPRYVAFREAWAAAHRDSARAMPSAVEMDAVLHAERLEAGGAKRTYQELVSRLPSGVMVADDESRAYLGLEGALLPWTPSGYGPPQPMASNVVRVLTPRSIVGAIRRGFRVDVHPSASPAAVGLDPPGRSTPPRSTPRRPGR